MSENNPKLEPGLVNGCVQLENNTHQCLLYNIGIHPLCRNEHPIQVNNEMIESSPTYVHPVK